MSVPRTDERTSMRFARLGRAGDEIPVILEGDRALDLRAITPDINGAFLADHGIDRARAAHEAGMLREVADAASLRTGAPIARPSAVYCIGMNYAAHAAESGAPPPTQLQAPFLHMARFEQAAPPAEVNDPPT